MSSIGDMVTSAFGGESDAARSARHAMERKMTKEQEAIDYLKGKEELPYYQSEYARGVMGDLYGIPEEETTVDDLLGRITGGDKYLGRLRDRGKLTPIFEKLLAGEYSPDSDIDEILSEVELTPNRIPQESRQLKNESLREIIEKGLTGEYTPEDPIEAQKRAQQEIIDRAMGSPLYSTMLKEGEDAILRNASATGGLRSGNVQEGLYDAQNRALLNLYNKELMGLSSFVGGGDQYTMPISNLISGMGQTWAQGTVAKGQAQIGAEAGATEALLGSIGNFAGGMPSFGGFGGGGGMTGGTLGGGNPFGASIAGGGGGTGLLGDASKFKLNI